MKARTEAARVKKKMESDVNELEVQVDQLNKNNAELMKTVKKMQQQIKVQVLAGEHADVCVLHAHV